MVRYNNTKMKISRTNKLIKSTKIARKNVVEYGEKRERSKQREDQKLEETPSKQNRNELKNK